jgi:microcystin-dependent protein
MTFRSSGYFASRILMAVVLAGAAHQGGAYMATPFLAEIRIFSFNFAPRGWAFCAGQLLSIQQNTALFSLLGTQYGGNGTTNFALPDLRSRVPIHLGNGFVQGEVGGEEAHTLSVSEIPSHNHFVNTSSILGNSATPAANFLAQSTHVALYSATLSNQTALQPATVGTAGNSEPHANIQPYLALNFCIALQGIFPSRN